MQRIGTPFTKEAAKALIAGDEVLITGTIYAARDAAHKRMLEDLAAGGELPFPVRDAIVYYAGPTPAKPGRPIGSAGPTTSYRMDAYTEKLLELGLSGMIGKGRRSDAVAAAIAKSGAVYFAAIGGAGALIASCVRASEVVAYPELGPEAVMRLEVVDFPALVVLDTRGGILYEAGRAAYLRSIGK